VNGIEVFGEDRSIGPTFFYMDKAGIEHVLGICVFQTSGLGSAGFDHGGHDWACGVQPIRREPYCADNQEHFVPFRGCDLNGRKISVGLVYGLLEFIFEQVGGFGGGRHKSYAFPQRLKAALHLLDLRRD